MKEKSNEENNSENDGESSNNDIRHYIALNEENYDDKNNNINDINNEQQTKAHNSYKHNNANTIIKSQNMIHTLPTINSPLQPQISSFKIKQMFLFHGLLRFQMKPSLTYFILPSLHSPSSSSNH